MVWCEKDGWVTVPEEQLPVVLPEVEKYLPTDTGESPLANIKEWVEITCPKCGEKARRETDTMPNWAGSDWYFLRYCDPKNDGAMADMKKMGYWMPVNVYVGGDEHNTLHLLYSRFIYQFLWDLGVVPKDIPEPYQKRMSHGVILGPDGNRMSKSKGNVIAPDEVADVYGSDALRTYLMFMGPFDATMAWNERSLIGVRRFLEKFYNFVFQKIEISDFRSQVSDKKVSVWVNKLVMMAEKDIASFKFNTVIAKMMETLNSLVKEEVKISVEDLGKIIKVLAPFAPFVAEELWAKIGGDFSVHIQKWPEFEEKYLMSDTVVITVQVNGKLRGTVVINPEANQEEVVEEVKKSEKINKYLEVGEIKKVIFVRGKTINFVVE